MFWDQFPPEKGYKSGLSEAWSPPFFRLPPPRSRGAPLSTRPRKGKCAPHGRRSALRPIAPHLSLLTSPLTCPTHNLTGRGPQRAWRSVRTILRRKRRCVGHLTYLNNLPFTYLTATIFLRTQSPSEHGRSLAVFGINFSWTSWSTCSSRTPRTFSHILESGIFWADSAGQMVSNPPRNIPFSFLPA